MKKLALLAATITMLAATAQNATSPYSKAGYGLLNDNASGIQRQMGGVGYAMQNGRIINTMNPASYSQVDSLTFLWDVGVELNNAWLHEDNPKPANGYNFGGGLDYISSQFRITKHLGGSFGLVPYSSVGYKYSGTTEGGTETRTGSGGMTQLYLGAGWEPFKGLSIGANVAYLFGTTTNETQLSNESTSFYRRVMQVRDWNVTAGVQYAFNPYYVWYGIIKSLVFAFVITSMSSYYGYNVRGGALDVGRASTNAVVNSNIMILFLDLVLSKLLL